MRAERERERDREREKEERESWAIASCFFQINLLIFTLIEDSPDVSGGRQL